MSKRFAGDPCPYCETSLPEPYQHTEVNAQSVTSASPTTSQAVPDAGHIRVSERADLMARQTPDDPGGSASAAVRSPVSPLAADGPRYLPLNVMAGLLAVFGALWVAAHVVAIVGQVRFQNLLDRAIDSPTSVPVAVIDGFIRRSSVVSTASLFIGLLGATVTIAVVTRRLYGNIDSLEAPERRYGVGWGAGAWFVPFLNLVRPKQIVNEIWVAGTTERYGETGRFRVSEPPGFLVFWWVLWILNNFVDRLLTPTLSASLSLTGLQSASQRFVYVLVFELATAIVTTAVFASLVARQARRAQLLGLGQRTLALRVLVPIAAIVAVVATLGAVALVEPGTSTVAPGADLREGVGIHFAELRPGDCWAPPPDDASSEALFVVLVVACDQPHDFEVYARADGMTGVLGPSGASAAASVACADEFEAAAGVSYHLSDLDMVPLTFLVEDQFPPEVGVICSYAEATGGRLSGSAVAQRLPHTDLLGPQAILRCGDLTDVAVRLLQRYVDYLQSGGTFEVDLADGRFLNLQKHQVYTVAKAEVLGCDIARVNRDIAARVDEATFATEEGATLAAEIAAEGYFVLP